MKFDILKKKILDLSFLFSSLVNTFYKSTLRQKTSKRRSVFHLSQDRPRKFVWYLTENLSHVFLYNFLYIPYNLFFQTTTKRHLLHKLQKLKLQMNKPHAKKSSSHPQQFQTEMSNLSPIVTYIATTKSATNHTKPYLN